MKNKYVVTIIYCLISFFAALCSFWILSYRFYHLSDSRFHWLLAVSLWLMGQFITGWLVDYFGRSQKFAAFGLCLVLLGRYLPVPLLSGAVIGIGLAFSNSGIFVTIRNQTLGKNHIFGTCLAMGLLGGYLGYFLGNHQVSFGIGLTGICFILIGLCLLTVEKPNAIYMKNHLVKQERIHGVGLCLGIAILGFISLCMNFQWNHLQNYDIIYALGIAIGMGGGTLFWNSFPQQWLLRFFTMLGAICFLYGTIPAVGMMAGISYGMIVTLLLACFLRLAENRPGRMLGIATTAYSIGMMPGILGWNFPCSNQMTGSIFLFLLFILCLTPFLGFSDAN